MADIEDYGSSGRSMGGAGVPGSPLFLDQTEARRAEHNVFEPPPSLRVWMTAPPPLI